MKLINASTKCGVALALAGILAIGPAMAEKPSWAGGGKADREERTDKRDNPRDDRRDGDRRSHFEERHRVIVRDYYGAHYSSGRCPPGLAKKHNGCMAPGQVKKWRIGRPLARDVIYYSVPQPLVVQIGQPPSGYRYVRVASDILLIAIGTGMIVDAIQDLGRN